MNNEDKKGLSKFQFSTEIDRADLENTRTIRIDPEVLQEEMRKLDAKKKGQSSSNKKNSRNGSNNSRRNSNRKYSNRKPNNRKPNRRRGNSKEDKTLEKKELEETIKLQTPVVEEAPIVEENVVVEREEVPVKEEVVEKKASFLKQDEEDIPLLEDEEELLAARNRKIYVVNENTMMMDAVIEEEAGKVLEEIQDTPAVEEVTEESDEVSEEVQSEVDTQEETPEEIPTAENTTVIISEEDVTPVEETDNSDVVELPKEEEEIPTIDANIPSIDENSIVEDEVMPYDDSLSTVQEVPSKVEEEEVIPYNDALSTVHEEKKKSKKKEKVEVEEEVIPYDDSLSTIQEVPSKVEEDQNEDDKVIPYNDSISTVQEEVVEDSKKNKGKSKKDVNVEYPLPGKKDVDFHDTLLEGTLVRDQILVNDEQKEDQIVEEVKAAMENRSLEDTTTIEVPETSDFVEEHPISKFYLDFHSRVILLIIGILVLFGSACFIIISTLRSNEVRKTDYVENASIHYEVCPSTTSSSSTCQEEGKVYKSNTSSKIKLDYKYEAELEEDIKYNVSYYIVVVNRIYDSNDNTKVFYEDEDYIVEKKSLSGTKNVAFEEKVELDYTKYNRFVEDYKKKYAHNINSSLEAVLYIDDGNETRSVSKVVIPLGSTEFKVQRESTVDGTGEYQYEVKDWTNTNTLYIVIGSFFVLLSLFLLFHLTKLALAVTGKKSKYQEELMSILNEYDRLIVIARDGYESNVEKKVIKLSTFEELLNARGVLNKPIIYSRVNNVKSEFIVEDDAVIYKFVLKEADLEK